jgi:hypothetical protein
MGQVDSYRSVAGEDIGPFAVLFGNDDSDEAMGRFIEIRRA